jgi:UDP:flavonoid glycosyltransferase YjiC (YdhE family)
MGHVLCCWELGAGYGHLYRLLPIAEALTRAGHQVSLVSKDIERAKPIFEPLGIQLLSAPVWSTPRRSFALSVNYSQNLLRNGYWHSPSLQKRVEGWLAIFNTYQPDLVIAEHAPTALLAARLADLPRGVTGTGFTMPPRLTPMPGIQPWFPLPEHHLQQTEREFLEIVNPVIRSLGGRDLVTVAEIFDQAESFLCTFPELDHYSKREPADYLGPILYTPDHQPATWPDFEGRRVFLYMHSCNRMLRPVLALLKELPVSVLACISGMPTDEIHTWEGDNLRIVTHPVNLAEVAKNCRLMISQGGANTGIYMLLHGVPIFLLPLELEQMLWAYRLSQQRLADTVNYFSSQPKIQINLMQLLESDTISNQAKKFSERYVNYDPHQTIQLIVKKCSLLINA